MLEAIYQPIVQFGFSIKESKFFQFYSLFVLILGLSLLWMGIKKLEIRQKFEQNPEEARKTFYTEKMPIMQYNQMKSELTKSELRNLQQSGAYRRFLKDKYNPHSIYNQSKIGEIVSDIEFSDEDQERKQD